MELPEWVKSAIFYQIVPDRFANGDRSNDPAGILPWGAPPTRDSFFGGDLQGILDHLPYLQDLGINAIYLTPIFKARTNHKYDASDYLEIDPAFGDKALFRRFVDSAHARGIRVVLDAVFNHCGDGFWAFEDLLKNGRNSRYVDWFFPTQYPVREGPPNYQTCGGADFLPKLNVTNPAVRDYLLDVATYWLREFAIDGWRLDVPWKADRAFWPQFREAVKAVNPQAYIVGEVWRDPEPWLRGDICDGIMNYPLRDYLLDYCVRDHMDAEDFAYYSRRLRDVYGETTPTQLNLLGSHDTARLLTLCGGDAARAQLTAVAQFTQPGAPMVYYGDEVGMIGENDPDCRRCMLWDERDWHHRISKTYRNLICLRREHPALRLGGCLDNLVFNGVYAYTRVYDRDEVLVVLNPRYAQNDLLVPLAAGQASARAWKDELSGKTFLASAGGIVVDVLPEKSALILTPVETG